MLPNSRICWLQAARQATWSSGSRRATLCPRRGARKKGAPAWLTDPPLPASHAAEGIMSGVGILLALVMTATAIGGSRYHRDRVSCGMCVTQSTDDVADCSDLRVIINDQQANRAEETVSVGDV